MGTTRRGRRPSTSPVHLEGVAFELFGSKGFDATTVDDIAKAAGIGRRTFFRYFDSKNDVVWGNFSEHLGYMREQFAQCPADQPLMDAVRTVVVDFNRFDPDEVPWHRRRMELILRTPALQAHSTLRYASWRQVVAEFAAHRLGVPEDSLVPQALAYTALGAALAAYEHWLANPGENLTDIMDSAMRDLANGFRVE
ncbi:mycofactocin system transcriptional regulator [Haloechinothrix salitolerans]|uniref:Mycofactocin system transcriptional regulator n=2 Tax=Haloechinothrix salitolerans TaxID=926830 RepID=A0ABW2C0A3_9PSEU